MDEIAAIKEELKRLRAAEEKIIGLESSLAGMSDFYDVQKKEIQELKKENKELKAENTAIKQHLKELEINMDEIDQLQRERNVEINGIPTTHNEDPIILAKQVCQKLDGAANIETAFRVKKRDGNSSLIIKFQSKDSRDRLIQQGKARRLTVKALDHRLPQASHDKFIFVNEHLSKNKKTLLSEAVKKKNEVKGKFVWVVNGKILYKKDEGANVIRINSMDDIRKIM